MWWPALLVMSWLWKPCGGGGRVPLVLRTSAKPVMVFPRPCPGCSPFQAPRKLFQ